MHPHLLNFIYRYNVRMAECTEMPVYNYIFDKNNLTWGKYMSLVRLGLHEPLDNALWYFFFTIFDFAT